MIGFRRRRAPRPIALYGLIGSGNVGNDASFETALDWLGTQDPEREVWCITPAVEEVRSRYGVRAVPLSWRGASGRVPGPLRALARIVERIVDVPRSWLMAGSVGAVVVPGMGVFEDSLGVMPWGLPLSLFLMALACRLRGREFVLLGVGAEPTANRFTRWLFVRTARLATGLSFRDSWSAEVMREAGLRTSAATYHDLAFAHPDRAAVAPSPGLVVVGVMAYYGRRDDPARGAAVRRAYVDTLVQALRQLLDDGARIVLVGGDAVDDDVALEIRGLLQAGSPGLDPDRVVVSRATTFTDLSAEVARAEVVVASRFHNVVCGLRLARPTVSVGYAHKSVRLMSEVGLEEYCQNILELDADRLVAQVRSARSSGDSISFRLGEVARIWERDVRSQLARVTPEAVGDSRRHGAAT